MGSDKSSREVKIPGIRGYRRIQWVDGKVANRKHLQSKSRKLEAQSQGLEGQHKSPAGTCVWQAKLVSLRQHSTLESAQIQDPTSTRSSGHSSEPLLACSPLSSCFRSRSIVRSASRSSSTQSVLLTYIMGVFGLSAGSCASGGARSMSRGDCWFRDQQGGLDLNSKTI